MPILYATKQRKDCLRYPWADNHYIWPAGLGRAKIT